MKKNIVFVFLLILLFHPVIAQKATFQLINSETHEDIEGVLVHSRLEKNLNKQLKTDFLGKCELLVAIDDTVSFEHADYFPIHLIVHSFKNFDFKHPVKIYLTPLNHASETKHIADFEGLNTFAYQLNQEHIKKDNHLKITILEHEEAQDKRAKWLSTTRDKYQSGFNIIDIKLK